MSVAWQISPVVPAVLLTAKKLSTHRMGCWVGPSTHLNLKHISAGIFLRPLSSSKVHPQYRNPHSAADNFTLATKGI